MSLDRCKAETSISQYLTWMQFLDWQVNAFDKNNFYLAQIAAEVRRSYVDKRSAVKFEDFLLKFSSKDETEDKPLDIVTRSNKMKQAFFAITGFIGSANKGKKLNGRRRPR